MRNNYLKSFLSFLRERHGQREKETGGESSFNDFFFFFISIGLSFIKITAHFPKMHSTEFEVTGEVGQHSER